MREKAENCERLTVKLEQHWGTHTILEKALVTIPITLTLPAISAIAGLALTLQRAPVHRRRGPTIKWLGQHLCLSKSLTSVISTSGLECLICSLVTNSRSAPEMFSTQSVEYDRQLKDGVKRMHWESSNSASDCGLWRTLFFVVLSLIQSLSFHLCWTICMTPVLNKELFDPRHGHRLDKQKVLWNLSSLTF